MNTLAVVHARALLGLSAPPVSVEVHLANGLPAFSIVGLPETSVRESRERVRAALLQSGLEFPNRRITVNLAPADLPKESGRFDLPIAIFESESGISSRQKNAVRCECARINGTDQTIRWQLQHLGMKVSDFLKSLLNNIIPNGLRERVRQANYERLARRRLSQS